MGPCLSNPHLYIGCVLSRSFFLVTCSTISGQPKSLKVTMGVRNAVLTNIPGKHMEVPFSSSGPEPHLAVKEGGICLLLFVGFWLLPLTLSAFSMPCHLCCCYPLWGRGVRGVVQLAPWGCHGNVKSALWALWYYGLPSRGQSPRLEPSRLPSGFCVYAAFSSCLSAWMGPFKGIHAPRRPWLPGHNQLRRAPWAAHENVRLLALPPEPPIVPWSPGPRSEPRGVMLDSHLGLIHSVHSGALEGRAQQHLAAKEECANSGLLELIFGSDLGLLSLCTTLLIPCLRMETLSLLSSCSCIPAALNNCLLNEGSKLVLLPLAQGALM